MDTPDLMRAIAARIDTHKATLGLRGVSYPALNTVPESPWAMVRESLTIPSTYEKPRLGHEVALPMIDVVLLVASSETRPGDAARLDGLTGPIRDLFHVQAGQNINAMLTGLDGSIDRVWDTATIRRVAVTWGEAGYCHAAVITMNAKFHRTPEAYA